LKIPANGFITNGICTRDLGNICSLDCKIGYNLRGSRIRECVVDKSLPENETRLSAYWSGIPTECESTMIISLWNTIKILINYLVKKCDSLFQNINVNLHCSTENLEYGTICYQKCPIGYKMIGSNLRICTAIQKWSGLAAKCIYTSSNFEYFQLIYILTRGFFLIFRLFWIC
jgi:hypothetical protein